VFVTSKDTFTLNGFSVWGFLWNAWKLSYQIERTFHKSGQTETEIPK